MIRQDTTHLLALALLLLPAVSGLPDSSMLGAGEKSAVITLFSFEGDFDLDSVGTSDAEVSLARGASGRALRVKTGHEATWPGVTLRPPQKKWNLALRTYLSARVKNVGTNRVTVYWRVDNPGADGQKHCVTESVALEPGRARAITVLLRPALFGEEGIEFIGMRGTPPVSTNLDPSNITRLLFFTSRPTEDHVFEIDDIRAGGSRPAVKRPLTAGEFFPMIDELGQYLHEDWPGKTHSPEELIAARRTEEKELRARVSPPDRNRYGGWTAGPELQATGFFRVQKHRGKWWLVDPEGRLFWSHGIDCVHARAATPITDRENYFRNLPESSSPFARFYGRGSWAPHGYYRDHTPYRTYDFSGVNLLRKYGNDWQKAFADRTHLRLRSWGLNTIANWSDATIYLMRRTPYVATINSGGRKLEGSKGYWGKFPDVFDPSFKASLQRRLAREVGRTAGDPWCIGYFVDNELSWGDETSLATAALASPSDQAAKRAFLSDLESKYGTIQKLNDAWGASHASWDALLQSREPPEREEGAHSDLASFYTRTAETYFRIVRDAVKAVAPDQLYLGCRFAWVNDRAARAAAKFCDVVGYNRYAYSVEDLRLPDGIDRPVIIGEFHFGALDRGMLHTGLRKARDQEHRAELYKEYVLGALRNRLIVGTHWFQYKDQATTGRGDGENYQIGFVDVCDRPYPEIVRTCREVGYRLYEHRLEGK